MKIFTFCLLLAGVITLVVTPAPQAEAQPPPAAGTPTLELLYTPDSSVRFAVADMALVDPSMHKYIRYLSLYNMPKILRPRVGETVSFVINSLSRRKKMYIPVFVGGSDGTVIRLNLKDYDIDPAQWDKLGREGSGPKPFPDPYFHYQISRGVVKDTAKKKTTKQVERRKLVPAGSYNGRPAFREEIVKETVEVEEDGPAEFKEKVVYAQAPWLDPVSIAALCNMTHSEVPMLRADWFIVNATLPPAYHNFLGLGNKAKDFENLVGADEEKSKKFKSQYKAVVVSSMVTRNNRTLTRSTTFTDGYIWVSHDALKSIDDKNYMKNYLDEKFDAAEYIASLPNGLQAYFVTDGEGNRVDFANPDIAVDNNAVDRVVRNGRSCMICHSEGVRPIEDNVRLLNRKLQNLESIMTLIPDEKNAYRVMDLFDSNLDKKVIRDQQIYADAVGECNGLEPNANAKQYARIYDSYQEYLLSKEIVAREIGVTIDDLEKYIRMSSDPLMLGMIKLPIRPVRRDQFEQSYGDFMLLVRAARLGRPMPPLSPPKK